MPTDEQPFRLDITEDAGTVTLRAGGEIDVATAPQIEERIGALVDAGNDVVLDLADVSFIDSSGLRALVTARQRADESGTSFVLAARSQAVDRLLQVTGLDSVFVNP